jgi:hypothetical protein
MSITDSLLLKIDGIFVKDIKITPNDYAVVKSINEIGHFMGKKTIVDYPFAGIKKGLLVSSPFLFCFNLPPPAEPI